MFYIVRSIATGYCFISEYAPPVRNSKFSLVASFTNYEDAHDYLISKCVNYESDLNYNI